MDKEKLQFFDVNINLKYTNKEPLTVKEIVDALESAEKLLYRTKPFIEAVGGDYVLQDIQIYVSSIKSGSLLEKLKVRLFYGSKEKKDKAVEGLSEFIANTNMKYVVIGAMSAIAGAGAMWAYKDANPTKSATHIEAYNSQVVNFGDNAVLSEKNVRDILNKLPNKKQIAKDTTRFISPAKKDADATIEIGAENERQIIINSKVIAETPEKYEPSKPKEKSESYDNIMIKVAALDIYNPNKWQGEIQDVIDSPIKLTFYDDIDIKKLSRTNFRANIEIVSKYNKSKKQYKPTEVFVSKVLD